MRTKRAGGAGRRGPGRPARLRELLMNTLFVLAAMAQWQCSGQAANGVVEVLAVQRTRSAQRAAVVAVWGAFLYFLISCGAPMPRPAAAAGCCWRSIKCRPTIGQAPGRSRAPLNRSYFLSKQQRVHFPGFVLASEGVSAGMKQSWAGSRCEFCVSRAR